MTPTLQHLTAFVCLALVLDAHAEKPPTGDAPTPAEQMLEAMREKRAEALVLESEAHAALDRADYDDAIAHHRRAAALRGEASGIERGLEAAIETAAAKYLKDLSSDDFAKRQRATVAMIGLGRRALPHLREAVKKAHGEGNAEIVARLRQVVSGIGIVRIDDAGRMCQWAKTAKASTQYGTVEWSANQVTGKPDTLRAGDIPTAWAPSSTSAGTEWLELGFAQPITAAKVRVHETYNPGAVVKVEVLDTAKKWHTIWEGKDPTRDAPAWLEVVPETTLRFQTQAVRITLDTKSVTGYNEIDAVELIGDP